MQSVPFRVIDANALSMECRNGQPLRGSLIHSHLARTSFPGAVDDSESSLWTSNSQVAYPQELGLQVLSKSQCTIRSLRVVVKQGQAPWKIEVLDATASQNSNRRHDPVSRYFSASFTRCCDPVEWRTPCSSFTHISEQRTIRVELRSCAFLKLLVYPPQPNSATANSDNQVVCIQELELLGAFEPIRAPSYRPPSSVRNADRPFLDKQPMHSADKSYGEELHTALLKAGVSLDIVTRVLALPSEGQVEQQDARCPPLELDAYARLSDSVSHSDGSHDHNHHQPRPTPPESHFNVEFQKPSVYPLNNEDESIFDAVVHHELLRMAKQDELVNKIVMQSDKSKSTLSLYTSLALGLQLPTITPQDRGNLLEIVMYTFGNSFAECLSSSSEIPEVRALCLSTAARYIAIVRDVMGAVVAFEGAVALLRLNLQDSNECVFQASLHLAQTVFQQHAGFLDDLHEGSVVLGLRYVIEAVLASPCCWELKTIGARAPTSRSASSSGVKCRINLDLFKFVRTLIAQEKTHLSFYRALLPIHSNNHRPPTSGNAGEFIGHTPIENRLRLVRFLLQRHRANLVRIPSQSLKSMQHYCDEIQNAAAIPAIASSNSSSKKEQLRLVGECRTLLLHADLEQNGAQGKSMELTSIYTHMSELESSGSEAPHEAVSGQSSFTLDQLQQHQEQTRKYFQARPRPQSLYQHTFTEESLYACRSGDSWLHFQKGNIEFRGAVEHRELDKVISFHENLERNTKPFVFQSPPPLQASTPLQEAKSVEKEIVTPFATFKGIAEARKFPAADLQPVAASTVQNTSRRAPSAQQQLVVSKAAVQKKQSVSARGAGTGSAKTVVVKQIEVASETPATQVASSGAMNSPEPMKPASSTRRIANTAPISLSRRSSAVADVAQSSLSQAVPASNALSQSKPGRQLPRTAPAGSQKHRDSNNGDEPSPTGCAVQ